LKVSSPHEFFSTFKEQPILCEKICRVSTFDRVDIVSWVTTGGAIYGGVNTQSCDDSPLTLLIYEDVLLVKTFT
jgi:hypothetical protein